MQQTHHLLYFTKKERTGIIVLLILIILVNSISHIYGDFYNSSNRPTDSALLRYTALLDAIDTTPATTHYNNYQASQIDNPANPSNHPDQRFRFNPNTLTPSGWQQLGIKEKTIATIQKYISKGGKFRTADDLDKIWGLQNDAASLKPYVRIEKARDSPPPPQHYPVKQYTRQSIDINTADSLAWLSLPGIGPSFTKRILKFRDKLGGFYSIEQVAETFGLPDSVFKLIRPQLIMNSTVSRFINLNTATIDELKNHPYIRYTYSNAIIQYREQHGKFTSVDDLKKILIIPDSVFLKLRPYLTL